MKEKIHYAIEAALVVAVIILFVLQFSGGNNKTPKTNLAVTDFENVSENMPIAYIDFDSLMTTYNYSIDVSEKVMRQFENSQATYAEQARRFQTEYTEFQRKVETGVFLTRERAEAEQQRLLKKQEDLQQLEMRLSQELDDERSRLQGELRQTIIAQVAEYNKDKGYQVIFGKVSDIILYANEVYNITAEVIEYLNMKYAESPVLKLND